MRLCATAGPWILAYAVIAAACASPRTARVGAPAAAPAAVDAPAAPESRRTFARLLELHDKDNDGRIARSEYGRTDQAFRNLDRDRDGSITKNDLERPVEMPPDLAAPFLIVRRFAGPDADSIAIGDLDEAFEAADADHDGAIDRAEFAGQAPQEGPDRFAPILAVADSDRDGKLRLAELKAYAAKRDKNGDGRISRRERMKPGADPPTGWIPPAERAKAPDFTLPRDDGEGSVTLSSFAGRKPVALIFGSFT